MDYIYIDMTEDFHFFCSLVIEYLFPDMRATPPQIRVSLGVAFCGPSPSLQRLPLRRLLPSSRKDKARRNGICSAVREAISGEENLSG